MSAPTTELGGDQHQPVPLLVSFIISVGRGLSRCAGLGRRAPRRVAHSPRAPAAHRMSARRRWFFSCATRSRLARSSCRRTSFRSSSASTTPSRWCARSSPTLRSLSSRRRRRLARHVALQPKRTRRGRPRFPQQVRKTYSGKVGGEQDDACIAMQLAVTGLRCFYTNEKYERFRRTNPALMA